MAGDSIESTVVGIVAHRVYPSAAVDKKKLQRLLQRRPHSELRYYGSSALDPPPGGVKDLVIKADSCHRFTSGRRGWIVEAVEDSGK